MAPGSDHDQPKPPPGSGDVPQNQKLIGWGFVAVQAALLVALVAVPGADHWPLPGWIRVVGLILVVVGLAVVAVSALRLGAALTPVPVPTERGALNTSGLYRLVRHPIYSGVMLAAIGVAARSGNIVTVGVAAALIAFLAVKASWEEKRLAEHYAEYADYASITPCFVPSPRRRH